MAGSARKPIARLVIVMPDLRARQLGRQRPQRLLETAGLGVTGGDGSVDRAAVDGHEGELGRHEEPTGRHQADEEQEQDRRRHRLRLGWRRGAARCGRRGRRLSRLGTVRAVHGRCEQSFGWGTSRGDREPARARHHSSENTAREPLPQPVWTTRQDLAFCEQGCGPAPSVPQVPSNAPAVRGGPWPAGFPLPRPGEPMTATTPTPSPSRRALLAGAAVGGSVRSPRRRRARRGRVVHAAALPRRALPAAEPSAIS